MVTMWMEVGATIGDKDKAMRKCRKDEIELGFWLLRVIFVSYIHPTVCGRKPWQCKKQSPIKPAISRPQKKNANFKSSKNKLPRSNLLKSTGGISSRQRLPKNMCYRLQLKVASPFCTSTAPKGLLWLTFYSPHPLYAS